MAGVCLSSCCCGALNILSLATGKDEREGSSPSWFNVHEIERIQHYVRQLLDHRPTVPCSDIGIIAPYQKQVCSPSLTPLPCTFDAAIFSVLLLAAVTPVPTTITKRSGNVWALHPLFACLPICNRGVLEKKRLGGGGMPGTQEAIVETLFLLNLACNGVGLFTGVQDT